MKKSLRVSLTVLSGLFGAALLLSNGLWAASSQDATITVTPVADVSLNLSASSLDFGSLAVNSSSNSATGLMLTNIGQVSVTVSKQITVQSNPAGWTAGSTPGLDQYVLYCSTGAARLQLSDFGASTVLGAQSNATNLTGPTGNVPVLNPTGAQNNVTLWFRLDMPTAISSSVGRSMTVRFTGSAQ